MARYRLLFETIKVTTRIEIQDRWDEECDSLEEANSSYGTRLLDAREIPATETFHVTRPVAIEKKDEETGVWFEVPYK